MIERLLVLTLDTDAIFTAAGGTIGAPTSLDHPPGAALLGAVANILYGRGDREAFAAVQLGGLRFSDGLPLVGGQVALPLPLSWHKPKVGASSGGGAPAHHDLSHDRPVGVQLAQERGGWVIPDGEEWRRVMIQPCRSLRTAISEEGRAREGLLYGFEAVPAGQRYLIQASADPQHEGLLDELLGTLRTSGLHLGRSRTAEFGRASLETTQSLAWPSDSNWSEPDVLRLLCLSDLALRDPDTGQPSLRPTEMAFGLTGGWKLALDRSFLRTRRYSPWNAHRRRPDLERQVIVAGSVLTFTGGEPVPEDVLARLRGGVGDHVGAGLGRLCVNPTALSSARITLVEEAQVPVGDGPMGEPPADGLGQWLKADLKQSKKTDESWRVAEELAVKARTWGVSPSQWGRLRAAAAAAVQRGDDDASPSALLKELRGLVEGVSVGAWGKRGEELFGRRTQGAQRRTDGAPDRRSQGMVTPRREATPVHAVHWEGGALEGWAKDERIHFARAVQILGRRAVRGASDDTNGGGR